MTRLALLIGLFALCGCDQDGDGWAWPGDCNDADPLVHPGATEFCGGIDENCNGLIDDGAIGIFYQDLDGDGQGNPAAPYTVDGCTAPPGLVADARDCDDLDPAVYDGADELCNGVDDDCDGLIDDADPSADPNDMTTWYFDDDGDGFAGDRTEQRCTSVFGQAMAPTDCDDTNPRVFPGAPEVCGDGAVDDCNNPDAAVCGFTGLRTAANATGRFIGTANNVIGGAYLMKDLDGDGIVDLLAGSETASLGRGALWVIRGPLTGGRTLSGGLAGDTGAGLGGAMVDAGDLDGDGLPDLVIAARGTDSLSGALYGVSGAPQSGFPGNAAWVAAGGPGEGAGYALLGPGDTDGDGVNELYIVGQAGDGTASLWHTNGRPPTVLADRLTAPEWTSTFGDAMAATGDVDGDGLPDVAIGDPSVSRIWLAHGGEPDVAEGVLTTGNCGAALAGVGDVDGDGLADLASACPGRTVDVTVPVYGWDGLALSELGNIDINARSSTGGESLAAVADVNGDGLPELAVGLATASLPNLSEGGVAVVLSPIRLGTADDAPITGGAANTDLGRTLVSGDANGDGFDDLLVEAGPARDTVGGTSQLLLFPYQLP